MSEYVVTGVPAILVPVLWEQAQPFLQDAIDESNGETNIEITYNELLEGECTLVLIYKEKTVVGAANLRKRDFDTGKSAMFVTLLGGTNMQDWIDDAHYVAKLIAKAAGCSDIYCVGRNGWEKVLKGIGYKRAYTLLSFSIEE